MESDHLQQFLAEIEERICTCGAGHGSGEGHTDWCEWVEEYSCPPAPEAQQEPVAWRWKPKDSAAWIYNPKPEWLEAQSRDEIDAEPLYTRPSEQAVTQAMVRAAAEILIGRVNAPEQEIYTATRDALKAAMEARQHSRRPAMNARDALDNFLHVYGQYSYHDEAVIRGTRTALLQLREAIDDALENGISGTELFATDGEGYELRVVCVSTIAAVGKPEYRVDDVHEIEERRRDRAAKLSIPFPSWDSDVVILPRSEVEAIRDKALEEAAVAVEPSRPRPCDCERCDCGNVGDLQAVTDWDADAASARLIRKLKSGGE